MAWKPILNLLVGAACFQGSLVAADWPQFRGPNNSGVTPRSQAPSQWSQTKNVAWSQKMPGYGWSSPIVVGDKILVTTAVSPKQKRPQPLSFPMFGNVKPPDAVYRWQPPRPLTFVGHQGRALGDISLKPDATSNASIAWSSTKACPEMASPLLYGDHLYISMQNTCILMCLEAKTGKDLYKERLKGAKSFTSSPWAHDRKLYCLDEDGQTFVVNAGPKFELLGKNEIKDMFWATPALSPDALYLRGADGLYCIRQ